MVRAKQCCTCNYAYAWEKHCDKLYTSISEDGTCEHWTAVHGEWIPTALCKPEDKEIVLLQGAGRFEYNAESGSFDSITDCFDRVPADNVRCWMRIPRAGI